MNLSPASCSRVEHQGGFSMVETAVAIAVVAVGIIALVGLFSINLTGSKESALDTIMAMKANEMMVKAQQSAYTDSVFIDDWPDDDLSAITSISNTFYYDPSGNLVADDSKAAFKALISLHNTFNDATIANPNLPISRDMTVLKIDMIQPARGTAGVITQTFQTFIMKN